MDKERISQEVRDYLDGTLKPDLAAELEKKLNSDPAVYQELIPAVHLMTALRGARLKEILNQIHQEEFPDERELQ